MATAKRPFPPNRITSATASRPEVTQGAHAHLPPKMAGDMAFRRFCTPKLSRYRTPDHDELAGRARFHLRNAEWVSLETSEGRVQTYVFEPAPSSSPPRSVLVAHGWTSEASFMAVISEQLRKAGLRVVAFDQPAHGKSTRSTASLIDCSRALHAVAEHFGPFHSALAHSMGCLATLLVGEGGPPMSSPYPFERYVLISSPNAFGEVTRTFTDELGLTEAGHMEFERRLERIAHRPVSTFTAVDFLNRINKPTLLIHDREDGDIEFRCAQEIAENCPNTELIASEGFGHRNILYAPPAIRAAIAFLRQK